jgi:hypothetical protein
MTWKEVSASRRQEEIMHIAQLVEQKLEALVAEATGSGGEMLSEHEKAKE